MGSYQKSSNVVTWLLDKYYTWDNFCVTKIKFIMYTIEDFATTTLLTQLYMRGSIQLKIRCTIY